MQPPIAARVNPPTWIQRGTGFVSIEKAGYQGESPWRFNPSRGCRSPSSAGHGHLTSSEFLFPEVDFRNRRPAANPLSPEHRLQHLREIPHPIRLCEVAAKTFVHELARHF